MSQKLLRIASAWLLLLVAGKTLGILQINQTSCVLSYTTWSHGEYLEINWTLPSDWLELSNGDEPSVTVRWLYFNKRNAGSCNHVTSTSCRWYRIGDDQAMNFMNLFNVNVTMTTRTGVLATGKWPVDPLDCVKPPKPDILNVRSVSSTCMDVQFGYSDEMDCMPMYDETYQLQWKSVANVHYQTKIINAPCNGFIQLCNLTRFTAYNVSVKCKKHDDRDTAVGRWSDINTATNTTMQDIPSESPEVTPGGYQYDSHDCSTGRSRTVTVYWKELDLRKRNGELLGYDVSVRNTSGAYSHTVDGGSAISYDLHLLCNSSYTIAVTARTAVGVSKVPSFVEVDVHKAPADLDVIPQLDYARKEVHISWLHRNSTTIDTRVTIIRCAKNSVGHCKSNVDWTVVSPPARTALLPFPSDDLAIHRYIYGVSLATTATYAGVTWGHCLFVWQHELEAPRGVEVSEGSYGLTINWENPPCESRTPGPYIDHFLIHYCVAEKREVGARCEVEGTTMEVEGSRNDVELVDVRPGVMYGVTITALGWNGTGSQPSAMAFGTVVVQAGLPLGTILGLIAGGVALVLLAGVGIIPVVRKVKKLIKPQTIADIEELMQMRAS